ncbi:hypothetical protein CHUAL_003800 [Chamberlinius hualienensis]
MTQEEGKDTAVLQESKKNLPFSDQLTKVKADKREKQAPPTKVVIRRLPPSMTLDTFTEQISPLPENDHMYFVKADMSLGQYAFSRAYINFLNNQDVFLFKEKFDGYVFVDSKGGEYPAVVEFAPFQKVPKKKQKKDSKCGTIENDPDYTKFVESWNNPEEVNLPSAEFYLEEIENREREMKANSGDLQGNTPLLEYLKQKKAEKIRIRDERREERRRRDLEKKRLKEEERRRRKLEKDKERERLKEKGGNEGDNDKSSACSKTTKEPSVKLLKNPEREKTKDLDFAESRSSFHKENAEVRQKVRVASGDKPSRTSFRGEPERSSFDSKTKVKDKFKDRKEKEKERYGKKSEGSHSTKSNADYKKDRDVEEQNSFRKTFSGSPASASKKPTGRSGKSYERTRESIARSKETRVTFDCSEDRSNESQKQDSKSDESKSETQLNEDVIQLEKFESENAESEKLSDDGETLQEDEKKKKKGSSSRSSHESKAERRIRNKDRPSMEIYRPGMRRFSIQRNSPQKESPSSSSSPSPTAQLVGKQTKSEEENTGDCQTDSCLNSPTDEQPPLEDKDSGEILDIATGNECFIDPLLTED